MFKKVLLTSILGTVMTIIGAVAEPTAEDLKTVSSKAYVDTQVATKQLKIPAAGQPNVGAGETVMTYTANGNGEIGERGLYSDTSSYNAATDGDKLITASALKDTFENLPTTDTTKLECANENDGCTLWSIIDQTAYGDFLPAGYTQRDYIYMQSGAYLLTDLVPTYDCKVEMDFATTSIPISRNDTLLGGRTEVYGGLQLFIISTAGRFAVDAFGTSTADRYISNVVAQANTHYKFTYNNQVATLESGGSMLFTNTFTGTNANGAALAIDALAQSGVQNNNAGIYLYSFKMWNAQGKLVANYVPAVQTNPQAVGFYDTVSGTFKTATAGTFTAGSAI